MSLGSLARVLVAGATLSLLACGQGEGDDSATGGGQALSSSDAPAAGAEQIVRAYYGATQTTDPTGHLTPIVADDAVLAAPSVKLLFGVPELQGKAAFVKAVAGNARILGKATLRDVVVKDGGLAVSRIDLPLPNGDTITQVEFFTLESGKIKRLDSYYDSLRFSAAIPAILLDQLKAAMGD
jgi:hypothetical protein